MVFVSDMETVGLSPAHDLGGLAHLLGRPHTDEETGPGGTAVMATCEQ